MPRALPAPEPQVEILSPGKLISLMNYFALSLDEILEEIYQLDESQLDELNLSELAQALSQLKPLIRRWILSRGY